MKRPRETLAFLLLLTLGLAPRLVFISRFPTIPVSDFHFLIVFGQYLRTHGIISNGWFWEFFNPGLPLLLYGLFGIFPHANPDSVARLATVFASGLLPILPFLIWRGVLPLWVRLLTGVSLALWPGQILFSGVVAQDNWVIFPSVFLGALAVRALTDGDRAWSVTAGLSYAAGVAIRQEMLIVLFPLLLAAAGVTFRVGRRRVLAVILAVALPLLALAAYRGAATGRFSLNTEHGGLAILGAYVPGAIGYGWIDPFPFIASVRPDLLYDRKALLSQAPLLAFRETLRRPAFHTGRMLSSVLTYAVSGEGNSLPWSLELPEVLPADLHERGARLGIRLKRPLRLEMAAIQGLFLAAVIIAIRRRNGAILALAAAVLLKYSLHAITAAQGRYFFVATALELLAIALAVYEVRSLFLPGNRRLAMWALAAGFGASAVLIFFAPWFAAFVRVHDIDPQRTYRFPLVLVDHSAALSCLVNQGILDALTVPLESIQSAVIRTFQHDPAPGEAAVALCELTGSGEPRPVTLQVLDSYAPGGLEGRMIQRVELDGTEVLSHDIAQEPGTGWANVPLGLVGTGTRKRVVVEVKAIRPDPGADWSDAARTTFQLVRP